MTGGTVTVREDADLGGVRDAYLGAVAAGRRELVVELPPGALGLGAAIPASLSLADVSATGPADIDVTLRAPDGLCVLVGAGLAVAARSVRLEGIAFVGGPPVAVDATVADGVVLDDVTVLAHLPDEQSGSTIQLVAAGGRGAEAELRDVVVGHSGAADAIIGAFCHAGSWWQTLALERVAATATAGDAILAIDSVASLRLRDCALAAGQARTLVRMLVAPTEAEIAASRLSAGAAAFASVIHDDPARPAPLRLVDGAALTVPAGELPPGFDGEAEEVAGATVDAEIAAAVDRARERVVAADARLAQRLP
ncbi:MAG: hypothetical protein ABWZ67_11895 [Solirubrobacteraceae bacterium]